MRIDGKPVASAHTLVRPGQTITLCAQNRIRAIRVLNIPTRRGPAPEAQSCYEDLITAESIDVANR